MFVLTFNSKKSGKMLAALLAVCFILGIAAGVKNFVFSRRETVSAPKANLAMETTHQMAEYIFSKGYTVDLQSARVKEVRIPKKFDREFENFNNKIKLTDGLSLEKYKNDKVNKWTFDIVDYDVEGKTAVAVMLVKKDKLIGTYIIQQPDGTAHSLSKNITGTDALE